MGLVARVPFSEAAQDACSALRYPIPTIPAVTFRRSRGPIRTEGPRLYRGKMVLRPALTLRERSTTAFATIVEILTVQAILAKLQLLNAPTSSVCLGNRL